jgi:uncharacterized protein YggE
MRTKKTFASMALAVLLLTAGCSSSLSPSGASAAPDDAAQPAQSITVGASGTAETSPDQAVVRVSIEVTGDDASAVRERLAENASQLRTALDEAGIAADQVRTRHYDIDRNHRRRHPERRMDEQPAYRGVHAIEVTLSNTSKAGDVIDVAVENGAGNVDGVRFTLSEEKRRDLREDALQDAMANARSQAGTLADEGNLTVESVHSIETSERPHHRAYETSAAAGGADASTSIDSGPVTVTTQVRVTYNATDA